MIIILKSASIRATTMKTYVKHGCDMLPIRNNRCVLGQAPFRRDRGAIADRSRVSTLFPSRTSTKFSTDRLYKMPMNNANDEASLAANLSDVVVTGQTTPHRVLTPSTIERAELMSQYTYSQDSLGLSNTPSSETRDTESHTEGPQTTAKPRLTLPHTPNFGWSNPGIFP